MKWGRGSHQQCMDFLCEGYTNGSTWTMKKSSWDKWDWDAWCEICKESIKEKRKKKSSWPCLRRPGWLKSSKLLPLSLDSVSKTKEQKTKQIKKPKQQQKQWGQVIGLPRKLPLKFVQSESRRNRQCKAGVPLTYLLVTVCLSPWSPRDHLPTDLLAGFEDSFTLKMKVLAILWNTSY